ncbi:hypothetical protein HMPREF1531_01574 [Propionibacterium sp. oral taxon 192 str. F0372]|uniref:CPBP family intramembrane glutamic endopeptidase n=1 Tax=Propionibacterium sp. oral taxon 192 TaxID=671222 RepID=UPI0003540C6C|nr:CPBP family intramembrane glutamic endopeptidase [Propionibacterium sp. oral taxon 192]EPH02268.1 hypothetical protein HMPREF1531_01574 [Propionibacterium sp. oral taxon 192 str. F0372]
MSNEPIPASGAVSEPRTTTDARVIAESDTAMAATTASTKGVVIFVILAVALAWILALPLWLGQGINSPLFLPVATATMLTPATAALIVVRFVEHRRILDALGLRPRGSAKRTVTWLAIAFATVLGLCFLSLVSSAVVGTYQFDVVGMSGFEQTFRAQLEHLGKSLDEVGLPLRVLWLLQFFNIATAAAVNTVVAAGEEIGWRGYLFPALSNRLGILGAVVTVGVIWGLWHAPLILLGYNYPSNPRLGVAAMCVLCTGIGAVLAWVSQKGGSVWPAALGHGTLNAAMSSFIAMFGDADFEPDALAGTIMGWGGWLVLLPVAGLVCWSMMRPGRKSGA